jgi:urate oxidase
MVKVSRDARTKRHTVRELSVDVALEGDFDAIHTRGDNTLCLPTDTMKNTVYALGKDHPLDSIESFALHLAGHFARRNSHVSSARVQIAETPWHRVLVAGRSRAARAVEHPHCFVKGSEERQTCNVLVARDPSLSKARATSAALHAGIVAGIENLVLLKSTDSAFSGYLKDEFTTLPETRDRIFATSISARWRFAPFPVARASRRAADFVACRESIRRALIETFAAHKSESVQQTLYAMGAAALKACRAIQTIRLSWPNKHCLLINLAPFGMENRNEIFVPTDEPHGLIEATIERR